MIRMLTWEQARTATRPRFCNVPKYERAGCACCELCADQFFDRSDEGRLILRCRQFEDDRPQFQPRAR